MALITCSECGKEFSDKAVACPNCGCPTEEAIKQPIPEAVVPVKPVGLAKAAPSEKTKILRDYLEKVRLLEKDVYTYDTIIENLSGKRIQISPKPAPIAVPVKPTPVKEPGKEPIDVGLIGALVPVSIIVGLVLLVLSAVFYFLFSMEALGNTLFIIAICCGVYSVGWPVIMGVLAIAEKDYKAKKARYDSYRSALASYEKASSLSNKRSLEIEEYEGRLPKELAFNKALDEELSRINKYKDETETVLKKMYEQNIVHRKYWGIVPISMFCEYIDTGRRTVLDGENGMYDLYEAELLGKQIVGELQVVNNNLRAINATLQNMSQKLSGIQRNQMLLYEAVMEGNTIARNISYEVANQSMRLDKLSDSVEGNLQQLRQSAELTAYNTAATARRTDALAKIAEYEFSLRHPSFPSV